MNRRDTRVTGRLLARRAGALKRHLAGARDGDAHDVHQARVASRRLREAVPVLTSGIKGSKAGKARGKIRRLTKALGTVRELDVTLQLIDELTAAETLPRLALEDVRAHVVAERDKRRTVMLKRLDRVNVEKLDRRLATVGDALAQSQSEEWRGSLGSRLMKRQKALRAAIADAGQLYSPEKLHGVRIASKKLRYAMELAADAGVKSAAAPLRAVKRAQDTLGRLHDLQILQQHVAAVQAAPATQTPPRGGLDIVGRALEDQCRHLHAAYVAMIPKLTALVEAVRTVVVPQLAYRARPPLRALKMTLKDRASARRTTRIVRAAGDENR
jgi:CHAD domain-containing protein